MKSNLFLRILFICAILATAASAAPISGVAWKDSTKAVDTLTFRHSVAANIVPTKSSAGTLDSFVLIGLNTLPTGITLNKTTGALSGTATGVFAAATRTIRVYSGTDSLTRTVRVAAVGLTSLAWKDSTKAADTLFFRHSIAANFPQTHLGGAVDSFLIIGTATLPTGITLDKTTGAFTGTPTGVFAAATRTIRAYAKAGTDSLTRTVRLSAVGLTSLTWKDSTKAADTLIFRMGTASAFPQTHLGGTVDSFLVVGVTTSLPAGVTLDKNTGAFTGTPTSIFAAANRTVRAYARAGTDSLTRTVRISSIGISSVAWKDSTKTVDTLIWKRGVAVNVVPTQFGAVDSFVVVGITVNLPEGITLNKTTGALTGTPTTTWAAANRTIRAYAGAGTDSLTRTLRLSTYLTTSLAWKDSTKPADTLNFITGQAVNILPTVLGGSLDSFANIGFNAALPAGLSLNAATGAITGTPTAAFAAANRTFRGFKMSLGDSLSRTVRFTVSLSATKNLHYTLDTATVAVGVPVTNAPTFIGRTPQTFSVSPALPAGLSLNTSTGVITGKPTATVAAANYGVTATDTVGTPDTTATVNLRLTVAASETYTGWTNHKTLWLNTNPTTAGTSITAAVTKFPVLVRLDSTNFAGFPALAANRHSLRFTKSNSVTPLNFEIERWDTLTKVAEVWVQVDTVYANNSTQTLIVHWTKSGVLPASNSAGVFDTLQGYRTVLHFTGTTNAVNETDATANAFVASNRSTVDIQNPGVIGLGRDFNGTNEYFRLLASPTGSLNFAANSNYTLSAWAKSDVALDNRAIITNGPLAYNLKINAAGMYEFAEYNNSSGTATGGSSANPWATQSATATTVTDTTQWQHVVGVSEGLTNRLYVNGVLVATNAGTAIANFTGASVIAGRSDTATVGRNADTATGFWGGDLDEVRLDGVARNADYLKLCYANQRTGGTFVAHALPVSVRSAMVEKGHNTLAYQRSGSGLLFLISGGESSKASFSILDMSGRAVWNHTVVTGAGSRQVAWNGSSDNGQPVSAGIYAVRVKLLDAGNKVLQVLQAKVALTR